MAAKKKSSSQIRKPCVCGDNCHDRHAWVPGYLLMGLGAVVLPLNFGLVAGVEWLRAWPILLVLVGAVLVFKVELCRRKST